MSEATVTLPQQRMGNTALFVASTLATGLAFAGLMTANAPVVWGTFLRFLGLGGASFLAYWWLVGRLEAWRVPQRAIGIGRLGLESATLVAMALLTLGLARPVMGWLPYRSLDVFLAAGSVLALGRLLQMGLALKVPATPNIAPEPMMSRTKVEVPLPQARGCTALPAPIRVRRGAAVHFIDPLTVAHFAARSKYTSFRTSKGRFLTDLSLETLAERLEAHGYFRTHRGHLVRLDTVKCLKRKGSAGEIELRDGVPVPVSRRKLAALRKRLGM